MELSESLKNSLKIILGGEALEAMKKTNTLLATMTIDEAFGDVEEKKNKISSDQNPDWDAYDQCASVMLILKSIKAVNTK